MNWLKCYGSNEYNRRNKINNVNKSSDEYDSSENCSRMYLVRQSTLVVRHHLVRYYSWTVRKVVKSTSNTDTYRLMGVSLLIKVTKSFFKRSISTDIFVDKKKNYPF